MKKAVIYARVSESRTSADSESCDVQDELCVKWCESQELRIIGRYRDHSISGKRADNRPGLQQALHDVMRHKAVLVVYSLSRFARNIRECLNLVDEIQKKGGNIACVKEQFSTTSATGELIFHIFASLNQFERRQISERTRDAMLSHMANGRIMSKSLPFGWMHEPGKPGRMVENPTEQRTIRRVVAYRQQGMTLRAIAEKMAEQADKYPTREGDWDFGRVNVILKRAVKMGLWKPPDKD